MTCIALTAAALAALVPMTLLVRRAACRVRRCGPRARHGGGPFGRSRWLRWVFDRVDATPAQERELRGAVEDLQRDARRAAARGDALRGAIADALRRDVLDADALGPVTQASEAARAELDAALTRGISRVHAALDGTQRERLADLIGRSRGRFGGADPYRGASHG